ncbi:MAG TPA: hypothetical protein GX499_06325 [Clostridiales bacterium]|nr:hypothetical protein [Clostridiales bacterium]
MDKQKSKNESRDNLAHLDMDVVNAASTTDCTGLIPSAPQNQFEEESYKAIYDYQADVKQ